MHSFNSDQEILYIPFYKRFFSILIDQFFFFIISIFLIVPAVKLEIDIVKYKINIISIYVIGVVFLYLWYKNSSSFGKKLCQLILVDGQTLKKPLFIKILMRYLVLFSYLAYMLCFQMKCPENICKTSQDFNSRGFLFATLLILPYISILFSRRKQALHDIISGTIVVGIISSDTMNKKLPLINRVILNIVTLIVFYGLAMFFFIGANID